MSRRPCIKPTDNDAGSLWWVWHQTHGFRVWKWDYTPHPNARLRWFAHAHLSITFDGAKHAGWHAIGRANPPFPNPPITVAARAKDVDLEAVLEGV